MDPKEVDPRERDFDPEEHHSVLEGDLKLTIEQEKAEKGVGEPFLEEKNPQTDGVLRPTAVSSGSFPEWPGCYSARQ